MNPLNQIKMPQICNKHHQPITQYEKSPNKGAYCEICLQEKNDLISVEQLLKTLNQIIIEQTKLYDDNIEQFQGWRDKLLKCKDSFIAQLDKIINAIVDQLEVVEKFKAQLMELIQYSTDHQETLTIIAKNGQKFFEERMPVKAQIQQQLQDLQKQSQKNLKELIDKLDQKPQLNIKEPLIDEWKIQYKVTQDLWKSVEKWCLAFAINKGSNILVVAQDEQIVVYQFNRGVIGNEIQRLIDHKTKVNCLYFMKQSNSFVSGSEDGVILIWEFVQEKTIWLQKNNKWQATSRLEVHQKKVYNITLNNSEDLMISSSLDQTIRFWNKCNSQWKIKQTITATNEVYEISLNEKENKLISCVEQQIYILEKQVDNIWRIVQIINIHSCILCFTSEEEFVLQPYDSDKMEIYYYNQGIRQFEKVDEVQNQKYEDNFEFFSCQYLQSLKIVSVKFGKQLIIFIRNSVSKYQLIQIIEFPHEQLFSRLSDDGEYLVTWDYGSKFIQVRRIQYSE